MCTNRLISRAPNKINRYKYPTHCSGLENGCGPGGKKKYFPQILHLQQSSQIRFCGPQQPSWHMLWNWQCHEKMVLTKLTRKKDQVFRTGNWSCWEWLEDQDFPCKSGMQRFCRYVYNQPSVEEGWGGSFPPTRHEAERGVSRTPGTEPFGDAVDLLTKHQKGTPIWWPQ